MDKSFVHLHVHTEYSLLDGANRSRDLARAASEMGMPACAITDHGVMYGCAEFYSSCKDAGIKPLLGCELYVAPSGHRDKTSKERYHLVAIAASDVGWHNLTRLVSIASTAGFYHKPRVDHDLIARYSEGLILSSACLAGEVPRLIMAGDEKGALARAMMYRDIVGDGNYYLEIQSNSIPEQETVNKAIIKMARENGLPLVATNDAHYLKREDAAWHDVLLCIGTKSAVTDVDRLRFTGDDYYFRSPEEMWAIFGDEVPDALTNTLKVAEMCSVDLPFGKGYALPEFKVAEGETLATHLRRVAHEGLAERLGGTIPDEYRERLEYELGVIEQMDFPGYFCIVADIISAAKRMGIPVGPGRGSAAGSLVAWACKITELDPIAHGLLFQRFLNPERVSMPDIDTDISDKQRDEVIEYIIGKYGEDHVAQIMTFGRMMSRNAVRDTGRAMGMPFADADRVARLVPDPMKTGIKRISEALEKVPELKEAYDADPSVRSLIDTAQKVEGLARQCGKHAAGIVITPMPTAEMVPVTRLSADGGSVTQFPMEPVEKLGLVKMDFLGLTTLSIIQGALDNIKASGGGDIDIEKIPMDDREVFEMLCASDTLGIFQLESGGMRELMRRLKPDRFEDLVALVALYRPGPLESGMADQYVRRKHGEERVEYPHPLLSEALAETYGVILYQEQVMQCASRLAGYTLGEADLLRRAMGKKKVEVMAAQRAKFVEGALEKGVPEAKSGEIFDIIEKFAGYGFNKSHSAAYALISYRTAWLKRHWPAEYMASYLSSVTERAKLAKKIADVREMGLEVCAPDINASVSDFTGSGRKILFGLSGVGRVGTAAVDEIIRARSEGGPFTSLWDFITRVDTRAVNKAVTENLIKAGAFASIEKNRRRLLEALPGMMEIASRMNDQPGQKSIFDEDERDEEPELPQVDDFSTRDLLACERESLGIYISGHPYDEYVKDERRIATCAISDLHYWCAPQGEARVLGLLVSAEERRTKKGDAMGILVLEDASSQVEAVCFPRQWPNVKPVLASGLPFVVSGTVRQEAKLSLIVDDIMPLSAVRDEAPSSIRIAVEDDGSMADFWEALPGELSRHPGGAAVLIDVTTSESSAVLRMRGHKVMPSPALSDRISEMSRGMARVVGA